MIAIPLVLLLAARQPMPATSPAPMASAPSPAVATAAPSPLATGAPTVVPLPSTSPAAAATTPAASAPGAAPSPAATVTPGAHATALPYAYRFVPRQPDHVPEGAPQIFAVYLNSNKLRSQGPIDIKVATSPDVVKVMTVSNGRESAIPMLGPGDFEAIGKLPKLPFIASGVTTTIDFVAVGPSGKRVTVPVPVRLQ